MKTTLYIQDELYRQAKSKAALEGKTLRQFIEEALALRISSHPAESPKPGHWIDRLPAIPEDAIKEIDAIISDPSFRKVDPKMWE